MNRDPKIDPQIGDELRCPRRNLVRRVTNRYGRVVIYQLVDPEEVAGDEFHQNVVGLEEWQKLAAPLALMTV